MVKFTFIVLACIFAVVSAQQVVDNFDDYRRHHPEAKFEVLVPIMKPNSTMLHYKIGRRVQGDEFVASTHEKVVFSEPHDYHYKLIYPKALGAVGGDYITTFGEIFVDYGSRAGRAYIVSGAIGQPRLNVLIEANRARYFRLNAYLYGYPAKN